MDSTQIFHLLDSYYPLRATVKKHLSQVLSSKQYPKYHQLLRPGKVPSNAWYICEGAARAYIFDDEKGEQVTTWFWLKGDIIIALGSFCRQVPTSIHIELLEDSVLQGISYPALERTVQLFPDFRYLERALVEEHLLRIYRHYYDRSSLPAQGRYQKLMENTPQLFHLAQVKDIASFLGMFPDTLSRLRAGK